jgi:hypothetical protein
MEGSIMKPKKIFQMMVRGKCKIRRTWYKKGDIIESKVTSYQINGTEMFVLYFEEETQSIHIPCQYLKFYTPEPQEAR